MIDNNILVAARATLIGLLVGCPHGHTSGNCPLAGKRRLAFPELLEWVQSIPDAELQDILFAHYRCSETMLTESIQTYEFALRGFSDLLKDPKGFFAWKD